MEKNERREEAKGKERCRKRTQKLKREGSDSRKRKQRGQWGKEEERKEEYKAADN